MVHRHTPPAHRAFARVMRADSTKAENILWQALRNRQLEGLKFKRQVPLSGFIVDLVCFEARLIVEVDGGQHSERASNVERDRTFEREGFRTLLERRCGEKYRWRVRDDPASSRAGMSASDAEREERVPESPSLGFSTT